jgi:hypothetical protein
MSMQNTWTRREALRAAILIAPLALIPRRGDAALPTARPDVGLVPGRAPGLVPGLVPGLRVGRCTLVEVRAVELGGIPVVLRAPDGHLFEVDILRHDPATPGVARAGALGLYVRNNGTGTTSTHEEEGLGAIALAGVLAREGADRRTPRLRTLRERAPHLVSR